MPSRFYFFLFLNVGECFFEFFFCIGVFSDNFMGPIIIFSCCFFFWHFGFTLIILCVFVLFFYCFVICVVTIFYCVFSEGLFLVLLFFKLL